MTIDPKQMLQHYTTESGFDGIVRSQSIWAFEFLSMEDKSELMYPLGKLAAAATALLKQRIPEDLRSELKIDLDEQSVPGRLDELRNQIENSDGYGSLFIVSFARPSKDHECKDGILSLWRHYTKYAGVCLEFGIQRIRELIEAERRWRSYGILIAVEVQYDVDETTYEFKRLADQLALYMQVALCKAYRDRRLAPDPRIPLFEQRFVGELTLYCAMHKNPAFEDEREVRIIAVPAPNAQNPGLGPIATIKKIHRLGDEPNGRRYIAICEDIVPGLRADGVIVGPRSSVTDVQMEALYPPMPIEALVPGEEMWRIEARYPHKPPHRKSGISV